LLLLTLHNYSDRTGSALVKQLHKQLVPSEEDISEKESNSSALPFTVLETAIANIASRVNYGLDSANIGGGSVPAALGIWRWEVKAEHRDWLPKAAREKAEARVLEREQVRQRIFCIGCFKISVNLNFEKKIGKEGSCRSL
jgi:chromatin assembly factor 1 subunit A